jgi:hypothetical protein
LPYPGRFSLIPAPASAGGSGRSARNCRCLAWVNASGKKTNRREVIMARCETCGNDYDKAFQVTMGTTTHTFDSFECAIHALAPTCKTCGIRIVGHGLEKEGTFFCCEHCAEKAGVTGLRDRIGAAA